MLARRITLAVALALALLSAPAAAADRLTLEIVVIPKEPKPDVFVLKGQVLDVATRAGAYSRSGAILQRRNCGGCAWYAFERFETDRDSRFKLHVPDLQVGERKVCYRIKVPRSAEVRKAFSARHCIAPIAS